MTPFFTGVITDEFSAGVVFTGLSYWCIQQYKKRFGKGQLQAVMYWFFPKNKQISSLPPSYLREYL
jgi:hypothetical protein